MGIKRTMTAEPHRRNGRPDQQASEELVRHIVDTATRLFIERGYPATSIEQISAASGSGKQTIYRRFKSKEGLFAEVINGQASRLIEMAAAAVTTSESPVEALKESCRLFFNFALMEDVIRLERALIAEIGRFPGLGDQVLDKFMAPFKDLLNRVLRSACDAGQIRVHEPELTYALMISLLIGWPTQQALIGRQPFGSPAEREAYFEAAWTLFLRGA